MKLGTLLTTVFLVLVAGVAHAADLFTQPIAAVTDQAVICRIANVSSSARDVSMVVIDYTGTTVESSGNLTVGAGESVALAASASSQAYCGFTVQGAKSNFRAGATVHSLSAGTDLFAVPAD